MFLLLGCLGCLLLCFVVVAVVLGGLCVGWVGGGGGVSVVVIVVFVCVCGCCCFLFCFLGGVVLFCINSLIFASNFLLLFFYTNYDV